MSSSGHLCTEQYAYDNKNLFSSSNERGVINSKTHFSIAQSPETSTHQFVEEDSEGL